MKKIFSVALIILFAGMVMEAQKVVFDLGAKLNYIQPGNSSRIDESNITIFSDFTDSTYIRRHTVSTYKREKDYETRLGYEVNGMFTVRFSDRFSMKSGLGLNFMSYKVSATSTFISSETLLVDTVQISDPGIIDFGSNCDCYENSISDVGEIDRSIGQEVLNLMIPASIGYDIVPGKLSIDLGMFFQTPVYAASHREYLTIESTTVDDMTKCKFVKVEDDNTSGAGISNHQFGVSSGISYAVMNNLRIDIGVRKLVSDLYVKEEYQLYPNDNNSFKPLIVSAGISYRFTRQKAEGTF